MDLKYNSITDINVFEKVNFTDLNILNLSVNKIQDINVLKKVNFDKLKELDISYNKISNINIIEQLNFKRLNKLFLMGLKLSDINILEKVNFEELQELYLGKNNISDISILEKVNFKKLNVLNLLENKISDISVFEKVKFKGLKELYLSVNNISNINVEGASSDKLSIVTTIFPEYDWVKEISGQCSDAVDKSAAENVDITMLLDNGVDLHSFQPTASDIAKISSCDIFIYVGGESDEWINDALKTATNKEMVVIDLLDVLGDSVKEEEVVEGMQDEEHEDEADEEHEDEDHSEEDAANKDENDETEGHHHEEGEVEYDEHAWLSLRNSQILVSEIADRMSEKDSANADAYKSNAEAYNNRLAELDKEYQTVVDSAEKDTILFGDRFPFRYMIEDYGLNYYAAFEGCSAETEASFDTVIFLADKVDELGLPVILTIENSDQRIAQTIINNTEAKNQEILVMDSLQSVTAKEADSGASYYGKMKDNLEILKKAIVAE